MLRKLNCFLNIVIGSSIGVFIGFGIYKFWHFKTYPNLYAIQSAPWYTELLLDGALMAVVVVVCIILRLDKIEQISYPLTTEILYPKTENVNAQMKLKPLWFGLFLILIET